jgi:hypothetical protein
VIVINCKAVGSVLARLEEKREAKCDIKEEERLKRKHALEEMCEAERGIKEEERLKRKHALEEKVYEMFTSEEKPSHAEMLERLYEFRV